jgi:hypothetical protein
VKKNVKELGVLLRKRLSRILRLNWSVLRESCRDVSENLKSRKRVKFYEKGHNV